MTTPSAGKGQSTQQRMLASLARSRDAEAKQAKPAAAPAPVDEASQQAAGDESASAGDPDPGPATEAAADEGKKDADVVPMAAFKERIGRMSAKIERLQEQLAARDLEAKKAAKAAELLQDALNKVRQQHADGVAFDERDDRLLQAELTERGRTLLQQLQAEHETALRQQTEAIQSEQLRETYRAQYAREISDALEQFPLVNRRELIAHLKEEATKKRPASTSQIAAMLHEQALTTARRVLGASEPPPSPMTTRRPGAVAQHRYSNNAKGMLAWVQERRTQ
jgi:hypothetical protein